MDVRDFDGAERDYLKVVQLLESAFGKHFPGIASAHLNRGLLRLQQGKVEEALSVFRVAQKVAECVLGDDGLQRAEIYQNIGVWWEPQVGVCA